MAGKGPMRAARGILAIGFGLLALLAVAAFGSLETKRIAITPGISVQERRMIIGMLVPHWGGEFAELTIDGRTYRRLDGWGDYHLKTPSGRLIFGLTRDWNDNRTILVVDPGKPMVVHSIGPYRLPGCFQLNTKSTEDCVESESGNVIVVTTGLARQRFAIDVGTRTITELVPPHR